MRMCCDFISALNFSSSQVFGGMVVGYISSFQPSVPFKDLFMISQVPQLTEVSWVYNTLKTVKFCEVATDFVDSIQVGFEMDFPDFSTVFVRIPYFTSVRRRFCEDHHWNPQNRWRLHKIGGAHRMAVTLHSVIQPECTQRIISSSDTYLSNYYPFFPVRDKMNAVEGRKEKFDCF